MRLLPGGDVLARVAHLHDRDVVVVAPQELLSARDDVADDERRPERIDDVLVVRVEHEAIFHLTLEADDGLQFEVLFDNLFHWLYFDSIIIAGAECFNLCGVVANVLMRLYAIKSAVLLGSCITVNILAFPVGNGVNS